MTTIAGFIDGILTGQSRPSGRATTCASFPTRSSGFSRLVKTMLNLSRIDNGELKLRPADFDISRNGAFHRAHL